MNTQRILSFFRLRRLETGFRLWRDSTRKFEYEPALRAELFSTEQMANHGTQLAREHILSPRSAADPLLARLSDNEALLVSSCETLTTATLSSRRVMPAAEWLLDNFYLIEEQIRIAQRHLPKGYSRELPRLANGPSTGLPRIYDTALEIISHGDGRVDSEILDRFVAAYQAVTPLTLGELWAIPIMLRLALIENLRRVASRVMAKWNDRCLADDWADRMTETVECDPKNVVLSVADMARSKPPMTSSFVAELVRRLQGQSSALALPLTWVEQNLAEAGQTIEHMVQMDAQQQAADQVSIGNSIGSLRLLSTTDWREFVESLSIVEQVLREDPSGVYVSMDFATRDNYRHVVERLARNSTHSEKNVARAAIKLAQANAGADHVGAVTSHVGFYLIGKGLPALEQHLGAHCTLGERYQRLLGRSPLSFYLGLNTVLMFLFAVPFFAAAQANGWHGLLLVLLTIPALLTTSRLALALVNWLVTLSVPPSMLPRLDFSAGIPAKARTLVVVPTLIARAKDIEELTEGLEVRFLANRDEHLHFALLTDFMDASTEVLEQDAALLALARERIDALNRKYPDSNHFFLFHRARYWNSAEQVWMGHERKRGKLAELNALLRGTGQERFALIVGNLAGLQQVRYVITLDTDTQLPRDTARQFIGAMEHPLNCAVYDPQQRRISAGYAILQPRVGISLPSTARSAYTCLFGSEAGIDPYTRAVSDVYQDLFQQGSFIGKGIYAVDAFEQAVAGCFPDNRILSHDLIEGCYARTSLLSDVQLFEEYPSSYSADSQRRHRWIRGDWQLLPWILPQVPTQCAGFEANRLCALARWKIFDNLRRSLEPAALLAMLLAGWFGLAQPAGWTLTILALLLIPSLLPPIQAMFQKPHDVPLDQHLAVVLRAAGQDVLRTALTLAWLPCEALSSLDAIASTLWRILVSHRRLLQWNPSCEVERTSAHDLPELYRLMWASPLLSGLVILALLPSPGALALAAPLVLLWMASPAIAWWLSKPATRAAFTPTNVELRFLRNLSRRTWAFFDSHVSQQGNWLPPDNIQEESTAVIAHRTSPTNMGMSLLAHLAAYDFGYLSAGRLLERLDQSFAVMSRLERHRNHFYNWYDTLSLQPLHPRYVSTVDSGNLAGLLLTLRPGLLALADDPLFDARQLTGLSDTLHVLRDTLPAAALDSREMHALQADLRAALATVPQSLPDAADCMHGLLDRAVALAAVLNATPESDVAFWLAALITQCGDQQAELYRFMLPSTMNGAGGDAVTPLPTWRHLAQLNADLWPQALRGQVAEVQRDASQRIATATRLAKLAEDLATMDFSFLYDTRCNLFAIGFNVDEHLRDAGYYDLLASEARLTNFVTIALGQSPQQSWFTLGRLLTSNGGVRVLLSWSGSMFEYLMPLLVMPSPEGTLLDQTCRAAVARQIEYGRQLGLPWGVSESAYNTRDINFNYQYRAFGVPGLGLQRGLGEDMVVAPYASALALMVAPQAACRNLQRLATQGLAGRYGLHEAIDYTAARLPRGHDSVVVRSFMAHHQGMSLLALASVLLDRPMQRRFESEPQFRANALLLQERIPKTAAEYLHASGLTTPDVGAQLATAQLRIFTDPDRRRPAVKLLSNGRYHVMVSSAGGGYSRCRELAVTRWHEDITCDNWGMFCYLRDVASGTFWSSAHQPTLRRLESYEAIFSEARAEFRIRERDFDTHTEIVVSPEDDIELRRIHVTNRARVRRTIELTSYAEVVLAPAISDAIHPAFSNLFVQTELLQPLQAILCTRRSRSSEEVAPWMCHLLAVHQVDIDSISYETDRRRFIGRGRSIVQPAAMDATPDDQGLLSNSAGAVLDPIVAIRCRITLDPDQSATIDLVTGVSDSREGCLQLIDKYRDRHLADRVFDLAWTHSQVLRRQFNISQVDAQLYEHLATSVIYANAAYRAEAGVLAANQRNQSGLWGHGVSGDLPIVLLQIHAAENIELVRQSVQAHTYWRMKGLAVDLVIWNEDRAGYRQHLHDLIMGLIASGIDASLIDRPGRVFVRLAQQLSNEDRTLMQSVARIILSDDHGSLAEQVHRRRVDPPLPQFEQNLPRLFETTPPQPAPKQGELILCNPYGGFTADGREYSITLMPGEATPAPWVNVLANPGFGTVISESGSAYTWSENAHEFRLTPWQNDPVGDACGEALYLRDEVTGHYWSPTLLPRRGHGAYMTRHGFGYSVFEHNEDSIHTELWVYVALDAPIKFYRLRIRNDSGRLRRLSATGYVEWVLGDLREKSAMHVVTEFDPLSGALLAHNTYSIEFPGRVAFFDVDSPSLSVTADRSEFLGRNGNLGAPAAMTQARLSGRTGGGLDPCGAIQVGLELGAGGSHELVFRLGAERDASTASALRLRYRGSMGAVEALDAVQAHWRETLGRVQVETPDPSIDVLVNGWLMYQVIVCRFWARSGYYQSGGAFGFRDQLQDVMAMLHAAPHAARQHLLLCASRQFPEGDVQHWWHPPLGRGVRTLCSDDYLWLALATSHYVRVTADHSVLDEPVGYIEGRPLDAGEESYYDLPTCAPLDETLYRHCVRAIEHSMGRGVHGLPLIGAGDWNDGMNRVGEQGRGESVWLGFFLYEVLQHFAKTARGYGDEPFARRCEEQAGTLQDSLEVHGWDGAWYRRAYFDDGTPLGSASNDECRIDSISQSWAVLSGAAPDGRRRQAMDELDRHLVRRDVGLIQLLDPPFDRSALDPGYIKGYVPGVRENGGQYTHAAVWATMAFAALGDSARTWELLRMINPVNHGCSAEAIEVYKVEPYVVAADVYGVFPHAGRGGWSWYTGSAGWMYRLMVESLLGLQREGERLRIRPVLPAHWPSFTLHYRFGETIYHIRVRQTAVGEGLSQFSLDGTLHSGEDIPLIDDGRDHQVEIRHPSEVSETSVTK
ncbi:GH36-type glycosyl hydrolase domain-containing protein [Pseudomonas sp.]|uniref:GH36-type glycosyl hydrolase domain-containing protein n=1 Tax=Pseudomonas sp. TaxID=306 RepID=UPI003FD8469E